MLGVRIPPGTIDDSPATPTGPRMSLSALSFDSKTLTGRVVGPMGFLGYVMTRWLCGGPTVMTRVILLCRQLLRLAFARV